MPILKIENFKCYKKASVHFGDLTVLVGANGAGKSSVVQSLLLLYEGMHIQKRHRLPLNDFKGQNLGRAYDVVYCNDTSLNIRLVWSVGKPFTSSMVILGVPESDTTLDIDIRVSRTGNNELSLNEFHFLSVDRMGASVAQPMCSSDYINVGEKGQYCAQLLAEKYRYKVDASRLYEVNSSPYLL